jgi:hypothetical protein
VSPTVLVGLIVICLGTLGAVGALLVSRRRAA